MEQNTPLTWSTKTIALSQLQEYQHNPRKIGQKEFAKLVRSLKEDGYHQRILIDADNT